LFDSARLPVHIQDRLMLGGYWISPDELRQTVDRWQDLDELDAAVAENQLDLMVKVMVR
jgi:hypothetical protein